MKGGRAFISFAKLKHLHSSMALPEVRDLDSLMVAKKILRFQISMEIVVLVHICKTLQGLEHNVPDLVLRKKPLALLHKLVHIHV